MDYLVSSIFLTRLLILFPGLCEIVERTSKLGGQIHNTKEEIWPQRLPVFWRQHPTALPQAAEEHGSRRAVVRRIQPKLYFMKIIYTNWLCKV